MKKIEIFVAVALVIAMAGVVSFWVAGFCGNLMVSQCSLVVAVFRVGEPWRVSV